MDNYRVVNKKRWRSLEEQFLQLKEKKTNLEAPVKTGWRHSTAEINKLNVSGRRARRLNAWQREFNVGRQVLQHQCPLHIQKWTICHGECWEQEESYQSRRNLSLPLPKSWRSSCFSGGKHSINKILPCFYSCRSGFGACLLHNWLILIHKCI